METYITLTIHFVKNDLKTGTLAYVVNSMLYILFLSFQIHYYHTGCIEKKAGEITDSHTLLLVLHSAY